MLRGELIDIIYIDYHVAGGGGGGLIYSIYRDYHLGGGTSQLLLELATLLNDI